MLWRLDRSWFGRACRAVRDNPEAAAAMGVDVARTKVIVFTLTSALAGVAGMVYAFVDNTVNPPIFGLENAFLLLFMVIVGGAGRHAGAVIGAILLFLLPFWLSPLVGHHHALVFGVLMVAAILLQPQGLIGIYDRILQVRKLTKRFGGLTAVSGLDFDLREGEILGLIGPNGAGKTTTFNLIAGAYAADAGEIRFAGDRSLGLPPHQIARRGIMRTFQHNRPFGGMPVLENVLVGAHTRFRKNPFSRKASRGGNRAAPSRRGADRVRRPGRAARRRRRHAVVRPGPAARDRARARRRAALILFDEPAAGLTPAEAERIAAA